jgi:hypothetical protein
MDRAFGRLPVDLDALAGAPSLASHLDAAIRGDPPATLDRSAIPFNPLMRNNNWAGICTIAAVLNGADAIETLDTGGALNIPTDAELPIYSGLAGCANTRDAILKTDGLVVLDVMRALATSGFDIGAVSPLISGFGTVPVGDRRQQAGCVDGLGLLYCGIDLYQRDMDTPADDVLDDDGHTDQGAFVSGHAGLWWDYLGLGDLDTGTFATWGGLQRFSMRWMARRLQEAHGLLLPGLVRANGTFWNNLDVVAIRAANARWLSA